MYQITHNKQIFEVTAKKDGAIIHHTKQTQENTQTGTQTEIHWDLQKISNDNTDTNFSILYKNQSYNVEVVQYDKDTKNIILNINGNRHELQAKTDLDLLLQKMGMDKTTATQVKDIKAPMPGLIREIKIQTGQSVQKGDALLILEAMKMENILKSPTEGIIKNIKVKQGENVEKNQLLIIFE